MLNLRQTLSKLFRIKYDSRKLFLKIIPSNINILEIGPFSNPVCVGKNVKYFDILSQEELKKRAKQIGNSQAIDNIPFIHYVSPTGDLTIIDSQFDAVISCHAIEHQLDLITHLQSISKILNEGGLYYLIVPDHRYCFDHFMNASTIADVLANYYNKIQAHTLKSVIEHRALTTHNKPKKHWNRSHGVIVDVEVKILKALEEFRKAEGANIDVHAWYFTPESFRNIVTILNNMKYIDLSVKEIVPTSYGNLEFYAVLQQVKL